MRATASIKQGGGRGEREGGGEGSEGRESMAMERHLLESSFKMKCF